MEFVSRFHIQQNENFRAVKHGRNEENKKKCTREGRKRIKRGEPGHLYLIPICGHFAPITKSAELMDSVKQTHTHTHSRSSLLWHRYHRRACRERRGHSVHEWVRLCFHTRIITSSTHYFPITACLQTPFFTSCPLPLCFHSDLLHLRAIWRLKI